MAQTYLSYLFSALALIHTHINQSYAMVGQIFTYSGLVRLLDVKE